MNDAFRVEFSGNTASWYYRSALGVDSLVGNVATPTLTSDWERKRITWWNGVDGSGNPATVCRIETWDGAKWVHATPDLYDTNQRNQGSSTNRAGLGFWGTSGYPILYDDTEIWRAS